MVEGGHRRKGAHCTGWDECIYGAVLLGQARAGAVPKTVPEQYQNSAINSAE